MGPVRLCLVWFIERASGVTSNQLHQLHVVAAGPRKFGSSTSEPSEPVRFYFCALGQSDPFDPLLLLK